MASSKNPEEDGVVMGLVWGFCSWRASLGEILEKMF